MKSTTPVRENDERAKEPPAVTTRAGAVVRTLPYLLAMLIISAPLMFAWGSFFVYYNKALEAFGDGRIVEGVWSLLQIALLIILVGFVALTFVLAGKGLSTAAWRLSEGRPILRAGLSSIRFGLVSVLVVATGVAFFTWSPLRETAADSRTLKESLEEAGTRVATLLGADADTAHAATEEPEAPAEPEEPATPEPENFSSEAPDEPIIDRQRGEERGNDPVPKVPSKERDTGAEESSKERDTGATGPDPKALDLAVPATGEAEPTPEESTPDETAAPPVVQEELAAEPAEPVVEPPAQSVPPEDEAPPEDGDSPEAPPADVPGLPPESDSLKYNLPETTSAVPPGSGDPLLP